MEAALRSALTSAMSSGNDVSARHVATCLQEMFYDQDWLTQNLVKSCIDLYLPSTFEYLLEQRPGLLTEPGDNDELSIKQVLCACLDFDCYDTTFYEIAHRIQSKYYR